MGPSSGPRPSVKEPRPYLTAEGAWEMEQTHLSSESTAILRGTHQERTLYMRDLRPYSYYCLDGTNYCCRRVIW